MNRRAVWVLIGSLFAMLGCDDDQPARADDLGSIDSEVDAEPPDARPAGRVRIITPAPGDTLGGGDDLDGDARSGVRIEVVVEAEGADDDQVRIEVDAFEDVREYRADLMDGRASTVVELPSAAQLRVRLRAEIISGGAPVVHEIEVIVNVGLAGISVDPSPTGGCDFGAPDDLDPERPGVQQILTATGPAVDAVEVRVVGGPTRTVPAEDGSAAVPITFADGRTEVWLVGQAADSRDFEVGPLIYTARAAAPTLTLDALPTTYGLAESEMRGGRVVWPLTGQTTGLALGSAVDLTWDPPLIGAPGGALVGPDGGFGLRPTLARQETWSGTLTAEVTDACGATVTIIRPLAFDSVVPVVRIVDPVDGDRLTALDDIDPDRADVQIAFTVEIDDPRPDADYPLAVYCGPEGRPDQLRSLIADDIPTRLGQPTPVVGTFRLEERGVINCVVQADSQPNSADGIASVFRLFFDEPTFEVTLPTPDAQCTSDAEVRVMGLGSGLDGNGPRLTVTPIDPDGGALDPIALAPQGDEVYRVDLDQLQLPDGVWILRFEGTIFGDVPIAIDPAEVGLTVDRRAPTVEFQSPTAPTVTDDDPAAPGFQTAVQLRVCGAAGGAVIVAGEIGGAPYRAEADVPPGDCADVDLPGFTAPLTPLSLSARAIDGCGNPGEVVVRTAIDPARIAATIIDPVEGAGLDAALDGDPERAGCQIDLDGRISGPGPDARIVVCTGVDQARPDVDCPTGNSALLGACAVMGVADVGTSVRCLLTLADGVHDLILVAVSDARVESAPVTVRADCSGPAVRTLTVEQDVDGNGCVHRQERINRDDAADNARIAAVFTVEGVADGTNLRLRTEAGLDLGVTAVQGGQGRIETSLPPGVHRLYLRGQDAVGNRLPEAGEAGVVLRPIEVDIRPPTPSLIGLDDGACLAAADDADAARGGLQYSVLVSTGRTAGEAVVGALRVDGVEVEARDGPIDRADFEASLSDGSRSLAVTVTDACGNVGSVAGFETNGGRPDWSRPRSVAIAVDTVPPGLSLVGVDDGAVLTADDDADGEPGNGFQLDAVVEVDPAAPLEPGSAVEIFVDDAPAVTEPADLRVPGAFDGLLPARLTLSGGPRRIIARAADACGNPGASRPVDLTVDIQGCASRIVGFDGNPEIRADAAPLTVAGEVDLVDLNCADAPVRLVIDGAPGPATVVGDGGAVRFDGVELDAGSHTLRLRVGPVREVTLDSPPQRVIIDPIGAAVRIIRPVGPDPAVLLTDARPDLNGQQTTIVAEISEPRVDTARRAQLTLDGRLIDEQAVPDDNEATVQFDDVTVLAGRQTLEVCVIDAAANTGCGRRVIDADPAPPGTVDPVDVRIVDPRATEVQLRFVAPGDDGALGTVSGYAVRRADAPFVDEGDWAAAAASAIELPAVAAAGEDEVLTLRGPGPTLPDGLALERLHAVAIRAVDEVGQLGPLVSVVVDLRLRTVSDTIAALGGDWEGGDVINTTSPIIGVGDVDRDGFDDLVVAVSQSADATGAALVFGGAEADDFESRALVTAPGMSDAFFGVVAAAAGDLNGDGAPDVAVQGYLDGFAGAAVAIYFGCPQACDRADLVAPDALVVTVSGRFTNSLAGVGDVWRPTGAGFDDLFIGGALGDESDAFVVAGRDDWPALPDAVRIGPGGDGDEVARLSTPAGPTGVYAAGLGDLDGDGFDDLALSAGGAINDSFVFYGGAWPGAVAFVEGDPDTVRLVDPCPGANPSFGTAFAGGVDLDGDPDGRPDFVVGNRANKRVVVFDAGRTPLDCFGRSPTQYGRFIDLAGDVDGDGAIDLIVTHGDPAARAAHIFYNDGLGRFGLGPMVSPRGADVTLNRPAIRKLGVAGAGDVNGDGRADVAAVHLDGEAGMTWIVYY